MVKTFCSLTLRVDGQCPGAKGLGYLGQPPNFKHDGSTSDRNCLTRRVPHKRVTQALLGRARSGPSCCASTVTQRLGSQCNLIGESWRLGQFKGPKGCGTMNLRRFHNLGMLKRHTTLISSESHIPLLIILSFMISYMEGTRNRLVEYAC